MVPIGAAPLDAEDATVVANLATSRPSVTRILIRITPVNPRTRMRLRVTGFRARSLLRLLAQVQYETLLVMPVIRQTIF